MKTGCGGGVLEFEVEERRTIGEASLGFRFGKLILRMLICVCWCLEDKA